MLLKEVLTAVLLALPLSQAALTTQLYTTTNIAGAIITRTSIFTAATAAAAGVYTTTDANGAIITKTGAAVAADATDATAAAAATGALTSVYTSTDLNGVVMTRTTVLTGTNTAATAATAATATGKSSSSSSATGKAVTTGLSTQTYTSTDPNGVLLTRTTTINLASAAAASSSSSSGTAATAGTATGVTTSTYTSTDPNGVLLTRTTTYTLGGSSSGTSTGSAKKSTTKQGSYVDNGRPDPSTSMTAFPLTPVTTLSQDSFYTVTQGTTKTYTSKRMHTTIYATVVVSGVTKVYSTTFAQRFSSQYTAVAEPSSGAIGLGSLTGTVGVIKTNMKTTIKYNAGSSFAWNASSLFGAFVLLISCLI